MKALGSRGKGKLPEGQANDDDDNAEKKSTAYPGSTFLASLKEAECQVLQLKEVFDSCNRQHGTPVSVDDVEKDVRRELEPFEGRWSQHGNALGFPNVGKVLVYLQFADNCCHTLLPSLNALVAAAGLTRENGTYSLAQFANILHDNQNRYRVRDQPDNRFVVGQKHCGGLPADSIQCLSQLGDIASRLIQVQRECAILCEKIKSVHPRAVQLGEDIESMFRVNFPQSNADIMETMLLASKHTHGLRVEGPVEHTCSICGSDEDDVGRDTVHQYAEILVPQVDGDGHAIDGSQCTHVFHAECMMSFLLSVAQDEKLSRACPDCRAPFALGDVRLFRARGRDAEESDSE